MDRSPRRGRKSSLRGPESGNPDIPWREIIGIRVILAHAYFHIDRDIVGGVITGEIPTLRSRLMAVADQLGA